VIVPVPLSLRVNGRPASLAVPVIVSPSTVQVISVNSAAS
jgi:hypothetical protein